MVNLDVAVQEFLIESREHLDQLDRDFVVLETTPGNRDKTVAIFRTIHTIKGTAGFLGFNKLESLTHAGEHLLSQARAGTILLDADLTSALLAMVDRVRATPKLVESTGSEGDVHRAALSSRLNDLRASRSGGPRPASPPATAPAATPKAPSTPAAPAPPTATTAPPAPSSPAPSSLARPSSRRRRRRSRRPRPPRLRPPHRRRPPDRQRRPLRRPTTRRRRT